MIGIHVVSTVPLRNNHSFLKLTSAEILTMILSCLYWKKYYGYIKLYTDFHFYKYLKSMNLVWLWDDIDLISLNKINPKIDLNKFWSYPKMFVNSLQTTPFCNLDLDLYLNKKIEYNKIDVLASHIENCNSKIYPNYHEIRELNTFNFKIYDKAINTSLIFVNNTDIYPTLVSSTEQFILKNPNLYETNQTDTLLLFVEQRVLYSLLIENGISFSTIIKEEYDVENCDFIKTKDTIEWDGIRHPSGINHLWHWKNVLRNDFNFLKLQTHLLMCELMHNFNLPNHKLKYINIGSTLMFLKL